MIRYRIVWHKIKFLNFCEKFKVCISGVKAESRVKQSGNKRRVKVKKIKLGLTVLALAMALTACKELKTAQDAFKNGGSENGKNEALNNLMGAIQGNNDSYEDLPPASDLEAYNNYIDLSNFMTGRVEESLNRYFTGVAATEDFSPVEGGYYITTTFSNYDYELLDNVEAQADLGTSYTEMDEHALTLIPTLRDLMKVLDEAGNYGNQKGYLDDNYAKGQEIHSRFVPAVNAYDEERLPYLNSLRAILQERQALDLEHFQKEGYTIRYQMLKLTILKSDIMNAIYKQEEISDENVLSLDVTEIRPKYEEMASVLAEFAVNYKDEAELEKEGFESYKSGQLSFFNNTITEFKVQTQALIARVDEQRPYSEAEKLTLRTTEGSLERLIKCSSDVTSRYNEVVG